MQTWEDFTEFSTYDNYSWILKPNIGAMTSNATEPFDQDEDNPFSGLVLIAQVFYSLVCLGGLIGNTLVIYIVARFPNMRTVTNFYILNLAIADELFLLGIPFLVVTVAINRWPFGAAVCKMYFALTAVNQITSSIFLTVLSGDRYLAVCHPISSPKYRRIVTARIVSILSWFLSILLMIPVFRFATTKQIDEGRETCGIFWSFEDLRIFTPETAQAAFTIHTFIFGFGIPLVFIIVFYSMVVAKLRSVSPGRKLMSPNRKRSQRKVSRLVLTVIAVYIICWLPHWILQLVLIMNPELAASSPYMMIVSLVTDCLAYSSSALNPFLYAFLSDNFRMCFRKIFRRQRRVPIIEFETFTNTKGRRFMESVARTRYLREPTIDPSTALSLTRPSRIRRSFRGQFLET